MGKKATSGTLYLNDRDDAREAFRAFARTRSICFWVLALGLVLLQVFFWLVTLKVISPDPTAGNRILYLKHEAPAGKMNGWVFVQGQENDPPSGDKEQAEVRPGTEEQEEHEGVPPGMPLPGPGGRMLVEPPVPDPGMNTWDMALARGFVFLRYILTFAVLLYSLCLLIGVKLTLVGRLGGIAKASKAFFLSLLLLIFIFPWQHLVAEDVPRVLYSYYGLLTAQEELSMEGSWVGYVGYFSRYVLIWAIGAVLLGLSQWRSEQSVRQVEARLRQVQEMERTGEILAAGAVPGPTDSEGTQG